MKRFPQQIVGNVGQCIYCGTKEGKLTDEHIIPKGLNGPFLLKKASCLECNRITSDFERDVLRKSLIEPRRGLDIPSKSKKNWPEYFELDVIKKGKEETIRLDPSDNFSMLIVPEYLQPSYFDGRKTEKGISIYALTKGPVSGPSIDYLKNKYDFEEFSKSVVWDANFPRLLAKIALGFAVARYGNDNFEKKYVIPYILGEKFDGISKWVGTAPDKIINDKEFHSVKVGVTDKGDAFVRIKLFGSWDVPEYLVVVGRLNKKMK